MLTDPTLARAEFAATSWEDASPNLPHGNSNPARLGDGTSGLSDKAMAVRLNHLEDPRPCSPDQTAPDAIARVRGAG